MSKEEQQQHITSIGGQAVMEGVMMRGHIKTAVAVRKPDGDIECKVEENGTKTRKKFWRLPIIRGCVSFVDSLVIGMKALMFSAEFVDIEEEEKTESKFDKWLDDKFGDKIKDIVIYVSIAISLVFSIALFMVLPTFLTKGAEKIGTLIPPISAFTDSHLFTSLFEGIIRMVIFIGYLAIVSNMKDIKRVFQYHGAEHKTIFCYEHGEELTVENVRKYKRFHPRCGTSFIFLTLAISILVYTLLPIYCELFIEAFGVSKLIGDMLRVCCKIIFLPIVVGISYELIRIAGKYDNVLTKIISAPGLAIQRLTTKEPADEMIEVAIASMKPVLPENAEDAKW